MACGRRWGKDVLGIDRATGYVLQGYPVAWYSPHYSLLQDTWRELKIITLPIIASKNEQEHRIEYVTGGSVDFWSLENPDASRGRRYAAVFINEAAHSRHLEYAWQYVIEPTLLDYRGVAWFMSTPSGRNYFWKMFLKAKTEADWQSWRYPTSANPHIDADYLLEKEQSLPLRVWSQEYLAEFLEDEGIVFPNVERCIYKPSEKPTRGHHKGHAMFVGVDWGKQGDFTAASVGCVDCSQEVALYRQRGVDYALMRQHIKGLADHWEPSRLIAESNAMGDPNIEELRRMGVKVVSFETTAVSKPPLIENMILAFDKMEWKFLDTPEATTELHAYERTVNPHTGRPRYGAPEGMHDDTVMARALMLRAATQGGRVFI